MKVFIVLWLIVNGQDMGGPPVEVPTMQECEARVAEIRKMQVPEGADLVRVGCVTEKKAGEPA